MILAFVYLNWLFLIIIQEEQKTGNTEFNTIQKIQKYLF